MRFRYSHLDPNLLRSLKSLMELMRLFFYLLLQAGGDVDQALRNMKRLQELGYLDETLDLEELNGFLRGLGAGKLLLAERLEIVDALARTAVGKVDKKALRLDIEAKLRKEGLF